MVVYEFSIPAYEYSAIWRALYGFLAPQSHIWGVVCIICVSLWAEIYTRIPDMYPARQLFLVLDLFLNNHE